MTTQPAFIVDEEVAQGGTFLPHEGSTSRQGPPPTDVDSCDPFMFVYDPRRYTVMSGKVIPQFKSLKMTPGVNGVDEVRDRRTGERIAVKTGMARSQVEDRNQRIIPFDAIPPSQHHLHGNGGKSYLWRPAGRPDVHLSIWTRVFPGSKEIEVDEQAYIAWVEWLVETGIIPPPPAHVLRKLLSQRIEERDMLSDRAVTHPSLKPDVERRTADIRAIEAELARRATAQRSAAAPVADGEAFDPTLEDEVEMGAPLAPPVAPPAPKPSRAPRAPKAPVPTQGEAT